MENRHLQRFWPFRLHWLRGRQPVLGAPARRAGRGGPKATAVVLLAIIAALMLLMLAALFEASRKKTAGTQPANLGQWAQTPVPVRAPLLLNGPAALWLLRGDVELRNARVKDTSRGGPEFSEFPVTQPIDSVERITISGARLWLNAGREPRGGGLPTDNAAVEHLLEPIKRLLFGALTLDGAQITMQRPSGGQQALDKVDLQLDVIAGRGATHASGRFLHRGQMMVFEARLLPIAALPAGPNAGWRLPAQVSIKSLFAVTKFDGDLRFDSGSLGFAGRLEMKGSHLGALAAWLGSPLPDAVRAGPFDIKADATWRDGVLTCEQAQVTIDGQMAQGALSLSLTGPRPFLDGALAFPVLDGGSLMGWLGLSPPPPVSPPAEAAGATPHEGPRPVRLALFDAVDGDLRVSAAKLAGLGPQNGNVAFSMTARDGVIVADIAEFDLAGGSISGQARIDQTGVAVSARARGAINNIDGGELLALAGDHHAPPLLTGKTRIRFDVQGRGRSQQEMLRSLTGEVQMSMLAGGRMQIDVPALLADVRERKVLAFATHEPHPANFETFDARLAIEHGIVVSEHLALRGDGVLMTGDGMIQAKAGRIYLRLLMDHGLGLARSARLGRSQSVLIHGDLANPWIVLEEPAGTPVSAAAVPDKGAGGRP